MKLADVKRYRQFTDIIEVIRPKTIIEIGTNTGKRAEDLCREALKYRSAVHYIGYDLFEDANPVTNAAEKNKKRPASERAVSELLSSIPGVTFELVKGNTRTTLHGTEMVADLVFIDGGHSVETIAGDYDAVKQSSCIVFDDYYTSGEDTKKFGCNEVVKHLPHELLPREDSHGGLSIKMAVVGYSTKWADAFKRIWKKDNIKTFAVWRPGFKRKVDMLAVINSLEPIMDVDPVLEEIREHCNRMFFVLKADGLRSLEWWRSEIGKKFDINEWFGAIHEYGAPANEVCGTARKLLLLGEIGAKGVMDESERFEHTKINIAKVANRLPQPPEPHDRTAIIVCYGPSLNDTWPDLLGHLKFSAGDVFSVSGAHDFILRRDVTPKYHVECDPRPHKTDNIKRQNGETEYLIASCCHPSLVDHLVGSKCNVTLWHMCNGEESFRTIDELEPDQFMVHGGGSAGLRAIAVAYVMGYRNFVIYGMDCSFKGEQEWAGPHAGKKKKSRTVVTCEGEKFETAPVMINYARQFLSTMENAPGAQFTLVGHGLLSAMVKAGMKQEETVPDFRDNAAGQQAVA
jgi:uncharacterized Rossmann fold enzyme/predicted O-methyltransferase YrrM